MEISKPRCQSGFGLLGTGKILSAGGAVSCISLWISSVCFSSGPSVVLGPSRQTLRKDEKKLHSFSK